MHREDGMGLIHIELFATLDLVGQAPGGPDEDPVGFPFGGWSSAVNPPSRHSVTASAVEVSAPWRRASPEGRRRGQLTLCGYLRSIDCR
jgi:hypothetical protein